MRSAVNNLVGLARHDSRALESNEALSIWEIAMR